MESEERKVCEATVAHLETGAFIPKTQGQNYETEIVQIFAEHCNVKNKTVIQPNSPLFDHLNLFLTVFYHFYNHSQFL